LNENSQTNLGSRAGNASDGLEQLLAWIGLRRFSNLDRAASREKLPFAMYAMELHTPFSKRVIKKNFNDFAHL
jgi:hypothetical protein